jgi:hypothetical protein
VCHDSCYWIDVFNVLHHISLGLRCWGSDMHGVVCKWTGLKLALFAAPQVRDQAPVQSSVPQVLHHRLCHSMFGTSWKCCKWVYWSLPNAHNSHARAKQQHVLLYEMKPVNQNSVWDDVPTIRRWGSKTRDESEIRDWIC